MTKPNYGKLTVGIIAAWFAFSLSASATHLFKGNPGRPGLPVAQAALTPILVFACGSQSRLHFASLHCHGARAH